MLTGPFHMGGGRGGRGGIGGGGAGASGSCCWNRVAFLAVASAVSLSPDAETANSWPIASRMLRSTIQKPDRGRRRIVVRLSPTDSHLIHSTPTKRLNYSTHHPPWGLALEPIAVSLGSLIAV